MQNPERHSESVNTYTNRSHEILRAYHTVDLQRDLLRGIERHKGL